MRVWGAAAAIAVAVFAMIIGAAAAGPLEDGEAAYRSGDYATALRLWQKLAEAGDAHAENWLGVLYHNGEGVTQNDATAAAWYRRAAEQGFAVAQFNLAAEYVAGAGVAHDDTQAAKWFGEAAKRGYVPAERELGTMYFRGRGVERSTAEAVKWWQEAANAGDADAAKAIREATAADTAARAEAARQEAVRKADLPDQIKQNRPVNDWQTWDTGCFDYVAADDFFEPAPRANIAPRRNCCPGVVTIKAVHKDTDGIARDYLVAFAAKTGGYCPVQFFGGWVNAAVMAK
jgi:hypothetical protein